MCRVPRYTRTVQNTLGFEIDMRELRIKDLLMFMDTRKLLDL